MSEITLDGRHGVVLDCQRWPYTMHDTVREIDFSIHDQKDQLTLILDTLILDVCDSVASVAMVGGWSAECRRRHEAITK